MAKVGPRSLLVAVAALVVVGLLYLWRTIRVEPPPAPSVTRPESSERAANDGASDRLEQPTTDPAPAPQGGLDASGAVAMPAAELAVPVALPVERAEPEAHTDTDRAEPASLSVLFQDASGEPIFTIAAVITSTRLAETEKEALAAVFERMETRPDGLASISDLPAGEYRVFSSKWPRVAHAIVRVEPGDDLDVRDIEIVENAELLRTIYTGPEQTAACQIVSDGKVYTRHLLIDPDAFPGHDHRGPTSPFIGRSVFVRYFEGDRYVDRIPEMEDGEWVTRCCD